MNLNVLKLEADQLQYDDLVELCNHLVVLIKEKRTTENSLTISKFKIGDYVEFDDRGKLYHGEIVKVKKVNIDVKCGLSTWTVPARFVRVYKP